MIVLLLLIYLTTIFINISSALLLKQSPAKFAAIPKLLIHYTDHMSIKKIKETKNAEKFYLKEVSSEEVKKYSSESSNWPSRYILTRIY